MAFKIIKDIGDVAGKRVLMRVDFNVPLQDGSVSEDYRLRKVFPTINHFRSLGAKVILLSHIESDKNNSLEPVYRYISSSFPVTFLKDPLGDKLRQRLAEQKDSEIVLLENLRQNPGEKANDDQFAKDLASLGDLYVNEAFPVSHRAHASIVGVPKYLPSYAGFRFADEIRHLSMAFKPAKPFLFILGGAKFDTKLPLITKFLELADYVFIGGALANDCFKAKGFEIGKSRVSETQVDLTSILANPKVSIPVDVVVQNGKDIIEKAPNEVAPGDTIWDSGAQTINQIRKLVQKSAFVLWNGPLGNFELGFKEATLEMAKTISLSETTSVIGGGDTVAAIAELNLEQKFGFISSGGGAMLDYLANGTLPGIEALESSTK